MEVRISQLALPDLAAYVEHRIRQAGESGKDGARPSHFYTGDEFPQPDQLRAERVEGWSRPLSVAAWLRSWGAWVDGSLVAHIELRGARYKAALHRATLGMGVEDRFRRKGIGNRLMNVALAWAEAEPEIAWIDLGVFSDNRAALRLYDRHNFAEWGRAEDAFRLEGESVTSLHLSLRLKS